jgi:hypothetical protein
VIIFLCQNSYRSIFETANNTNCTSVSMRYSSPQNAMIVTYLFKLIKLKLFDHERTLAAATPNCTWICWNLHIMKACINFNKLQDIQNWKHQCLACEKTIKLDRNRHATIVFSVRKESESEIQLTTSSSLHLKQKIKPMQFSQSILMWQVSSTRH